MVWVRGVNPGASSNFYGRPGFADTLRMDGCLGASATSAAGGGAGKLAPSIGYTECAVAAPMLFTEKLATPRLGAPGSSGKDHGP